eukprot:CAMPEP_0206175810 /NCGR_PEP_ID=MMETSP1474-20131121/56176_1 /ASSEMBLY_ACC=CAM_ASM_001110 /TAXON_ID=97495 /ORGANISM="Imantonia sp., Strain RCC918" /LENGTH=85 /DNA_ID=CAMNT_0053586359 /DNA_START=173 /DNA_END=430 /DNA_ORIENTATION=+
MLATLTLLPGWTTISQATYGAQISEIQSQLAGGPATRTLHDVCGEASGEGDAATRPDEQLRAEHARERDGWNVGDGLERPAGERE